MKILSRDHRFSHVDWLFSSSNESLQTHMQPSAIHDYQISTQQTFYSWCQELNKIPATLYLQGFLFPIRFLSSSSFSPPDFPYLTGVHDTGAARAGLMCTAPPAAVSRFCWWYMTSSSRAACSELLRCLSSRWNWWGLFRGHQPLFGRTPLIFLLECCSAVQQSAQHQSHEARQQKPFTTRSSACRRRNTMCFCAG